VKWLPELPRVGISATVLCASIHVGEGAFTGADAMILDNDFHHPAENSGWESAPAHLQPIQSGIFRPAMFWHGRLSP